MTLVTPEDYIRLTGDEASTGIQEAIDEAEELVELFLKRKLEHGAWTESLKVYNDGVTSRVYPSNKPVTAVSAPAGAVLLDNSVVAGPAPYDIVYNGTWPMGSEVVITYTGGWTADTLPGPIRRAVVIIAAGLLAMKSPVAGGNPTAGATTIKLGDAIVSYGPGGAGRSALESGEVPAPVARTLKRWRHDPVSA